MKKTSLFLMMPAAVLILMSAKCSKDVSKAQKLDCQYSSDVTLTNHNLEGADYECDCEVSISGGTFTINPGVEIYFKSGGGLTVEGDGTIRALGNSATPIAMTDFEGAWKGIRINTNKQNNELNSVNISNAGLNGFSTVIAGFTHDNKASVIIEGTAKIHNTMVNSSKGYGIAYLASSTSTGFSGNTITNSNGYPLFIYGGQLNNTSLANCSFTGNSKNYIGIYSLTSNATIDEDVNFIETAVPYYGITSLELRGVTIMAAGTELVMSNDNGIYVYGNQYMVINGTANNPVTIRGESALAGFWQGLLVNTNNPNNIFNYLNISDGGSSKLGLMPKKANLALANAAPAQLTLNNCTSTNYSGAQISVSGTDGAFTNNSPQITVIEIH